jgi:hypothetical protein
MKYIFVPILLISLTLSSLAQEFKVYPNGYIYSEKTMTKLATIADSLNLKFKQCDLNPSFYSFAQAEVCYITLDTKKAKRVAKDLDNNISYDSFLKKYPNCIVKDGWGFTFNYQDEIGTKSVFKVLNQTGYYDYSIESYDTSLLNKAMLGKWVYSFTYDNNIEAIYFPNPLTKTKLPEKYAQMIGYADCLIDTTTTKMLEDADFGDVELPRRWRNLKIEKQEDLLNNLRSTRVTGFCSMDTRPRTHAVNIALVSAEVARWEVFLKAHLDIMNDRFDRVSDGSYAWAERKTYIKELEALDIDVYKLIFGIVLRADNLADNHYYGSIARVGRALSEASDLDKVEEQILGAVKDQQLDVYNRMLFYYLFLNYNHHLEDTARQEINNKKIKKAIYTLPETIYQELEAKEKENKQ